MVSSQGALYSNNIAYFYFVCCFFIFLYIWNIVHHTISDVPAAQQWIIQVLHSPTSMPILSIILPTPSPDAVVLLHSPLALSSPTV